MKEIKTVALVGLGAIGAYFADRLQPVLGDDLRVIAGGARAERIHREGLVINGKQEYYHVVEPGEGEPADLVIFATKMSGLQQAIEDVRAQIGPEIAATLGIADVSAAVGISYEKEGFLELGVSPLQAPDKPTYVTIHFEKGIPTAIDGKEMGAVELVEKLNELGGANGIGLADLVENRLVGMKSRGVYETPGGTILYHAHDVLETITLDKETARTKQYLSIKFADIVYNGQWYTPLREALSAFVTETQKTVTGDVKLKLYKGNIINAGVTSPYTLYDEEVATFDAEDVYNQKDAEGFINLFGLPIHVKAVLDQKRGK